MSDVDVVVVGGGPVGLFLGCLLVQRGVSCRVLEKRATPTAHSRSIGIHPPALEKLADVGIAEELIDRSVVVSEGIAFTNAREIGRISFDSCPPPYRFILAIPQSDTEAILTRQLNISDESALVLDCEVQIVQQDESGVTISTSKGDFRSSLLVGCDGQESFVRESEGIDFPGEPYEDVFLMGDFEDHTDFGNRAAIYLTDDGVVESFPLPDGIRRWVVKTDFLMEAREPDQLSKLVLERTGHVVPSESCTMLSPFSIYHFLAQRMAVGRILLAGDAAHVVSPIGGQGMNLGWLDAWDAVYTIQDALKSPTERPKLYANYDAARRKAARKATKRSEFNMWMGRSASSEKLNFVLLKLILGTPLRSYFARQFTMRGI